MLGDSANGANTSSVGSGVGGSDVSGDRANGANTFSVVSGVDDGGGDMTMGLGENSEVNSGRGIGLSGGLGRPREAGAGAGRAQGARAGSLEELMATILQNAGQRGDRQAGGWGSAWRDDVSARSDKFVKRCRQLCHERPGDRPAAWRAVLALFKCTFKSEQNRAGILQTRPLTNLCTGKLVEFLEQGTGEDTNGDFVAWADEFMSQVQQQVAEFAPAMEAAGMGLWTAPALPQRNRAGGGVQVEITVKTANGSTSEGLSDDLRKFLFPYSPEERGQMCAGGAVHLQDEQAQQWGDLDPPEINTDRRTVMMMKTEEVALWLTTGKPRELGAVRDGWWLVRHKGSEYRLRMRPLWTEAELHERGLKLTVTDKHSRNAQWFYNELWAKFIRLLWTAAPASVSEHDIADLLKAQLLMQGVQVASVVLLSPVKVHSRTLLGRTCSATKDVWVIFEDPDDRTRAMRQYVDLWAGDCMQSTVEGAKAAAGVALVARLEPRQMSQRGRPVVSPTAAAGGPTQWTYGVEMRFPPTTRVADVLPQGQGTRLEDLQVYVNNALCATYLKGQHGTVRDMVDSDHGDFGFVEVQHPTPEPKPPSGSARGRLNGVVGLATASGAWDGGKLYIACASWAAARALLLTLEDSPSEARVHCTVGWSSSSPPAVSAGFIIHRAGEREVTGFHRVESGAIWDRANAMAMRVVDSLALDVLLPDERRAIVAAGLAEDREQLEGACALCSAQSHNAVAVDDGIVCELCATQTALLAACADDFDEEHFNSGIPTALCGAGKCSVESCPFRDSQERQWVMFTHREDMVPKCHKCWREAMVAAEYAYKPALSEEMDRPVLEYLMGQAYSVMKHMAGRGRAFQHAQ